MKLQVMLGVAVAITAGPVGAQGYSGYAPKPPASTYGPPSSSPFKPYQGTSSYSSRGGVNAYPAAPKPKASTTSLFGPDDKRKR